MSRSKDAPTGLRRNTVKALLEGVVDDLDARFQSEDAARLDLLGISTGLKSLDHRTGGLVRGSLTVVAGDNGAGKTSLVHNLLEYAALREGRPSLLISSAAPAERLTTWFVSSLGRLDAQRIESARLDDEDWPRLTAATKLLAGAPLTIAAAGRYTINQLEDTVAAHFPAAKPDVNGDMRPAGVLVIDSILSVYNPQMAEYRATELADSARRLKSLAMAHDLAVIVTAHPNRSFMNRPDKRLVLWDLRESGALVDVADAVWLLYRDEMYNHDSPHMGTAEIYVAKAAGAVGGLRTAFIGRFRRFENLLPEDYDEK